VKGPDYFPTLSHEGVVIEYPFAVVERFTEKMKSGFVCVIQFTPQEPFASEGYPPERVKMIASVTGDPAVLPISTPTRAWNHRYPLENGGSDGRLCLWTPWASRAERWEWQDGVATLIRIVHRHLTFEEYWRRTGEWPVEDTPHGPRIFHDDAEPATSDSASAA
jgi:hypothetical protein